MKKNKFIIAAAFAAALVSCSQDENLNSSNDYTELLNSGQIAFATTNASRAGETLTELSNFYVTAESANGYYFKDQLFTKNGTVFTSDTKFYWPTTGTLSFYAVNYMGTVNSSFSPYGPAYDYTDWDGSKDLVVAEVDCSEKQIPCPLTFKHATAKVGYKALAKDQTEELSYSLYAVRMTTPAKGTLAFGISDAQPFPVYWSIDNNTTKTYDYGLPSSGVTFNQTGSNASGNTTFNVLPVTDGNITFEVEYKVLKNGNVISDFTGTNKKTVTVTNPNLTPGKKYVYNFLLTRGTDETITFSTTVSAWETGDTQDVDLPLCSPDGYVDGYPYVIINGVKWATMNIGATSETEYGLYFAWGDTQGHCLNGVADYEFTEANYNNSAAASIFTDLDESNDAAYRYVLHNDVEQNLRGTNWRMPTKTELQSLGKGQWITINGVNGRKYTDPTSGKFIFLPAAGNFEKNTLENDGRIGIYYSSTFIEAGKAGGLMFVNSSANTPDLGGLYSGATIRAVYGN